MKKFKEIIGMFLIAAIIPAFAACNRPEPAGKGENEVKNDVKDDGRDAEVAEESDGKTDATEEKSERASGKVADNQSETELISAEDAKQMRIEYIEKINQSRPPYGVELGMNSIEEPDENFKTAYERYDHLLNEIYGELKKVMPEDEFKKLEKEQIEWIKKKEADAANEYKKSIEEDALPEDMAENDKYANLYGNTKERCYYLVMQIGEEGREKRREFREGYSHIFDDMKPLSDTASQYEMNMNSKESYERVEKYYDKICAYHKENMKTDEFAVFESKEKQWKTERDAEVDEHYRSYEGGSIAPLMANGMGSSYTYDRIQYVIALIG